MEIAPMHCKSHDKSMRWVLHKRTRTPSYRNNKNWTLKNNKKCVNYEPHWLPWLTKCNKNNRHWLADSKKRRQHCYSCRWEYVINKMFLPKKVTKQKQRKRKLSVILCNAKLKLHNDCKKNWKSRNNRCDNKVSCVIVDNCKHYSIKLSSVKAELQKCDNSAI